MPTPPAPPQRLWNDAQRQQVKYLLSQGETAATVAVVMKISRNAVLGRIWRDPELNYAHFLKTGSPKTPPRPRVYAPRAPRPPKPAPEPAPEPIPEPVIAYVPVPLVETGTRLCKWPVEMDRSVIGGLLCCGAPVIPGDRYCLLHRQKSAGNG